MEGDDSSRDATDAISPSQGLRRVLEKHVHSYLHNALTSRTPRYSKDGSGAGARNRRTWEIKKVIFNTDDKEREMGQQVRFDAPADTNTAVQRNRGKDGRNIQRLDDGAYIRPLQLSDAPLVDAWWEHRSASSLSTVARCISADLNGDVGACLGIVGPDDALRAGIVRYEGGAVGMLFVAEPYRCRGYGEALLRQATKAIEDAADECIALILDGNVASEATFVKVGWEREGPTAKKGTGSRRANRKWIKR